jgi:hypothetical protein
MKKVALLSLFCAVTAIFYYVVYDMVSNNIAEAPTLIQSETINTDTYSFKALQYSTDLISFRYPYEYGVENDIAEGVLTLIPPEEAALPIKFYTASTSVESFETFATIVESDFESHVVAVLDSSKKNEYQYSFTIETHNDLPILIHKRNFESMTGDLKEAYVWLGNGNIVTVSSEGSEIFDEIISSIRRP